MNDFTKEELKWLIETVEHCIERYHEQNPAYSVRDKLQTLIDNCCTHWPLSKDEDGNYYCNRCERVINV